MISKVTLQDFGCYSDNTVALNPHVNWFLGPTGAGKSTILRGIEYALAGVNEMTDARGSGVDLCLRAGAKHAVVELELANGMKWKRHIPTTHNIPRLQEKLNAADAEKEWRGIPKPDVIRALFEARHLLTMEPKAQQALFLNAVDGDVSDEALIEAMRTANPQFGEDLATFFAAHIEEAKLAKDYHAYVYEQRRIANKDRDESGARLRHLRDSQPTSFDGESDSATPAALLEQWRTEREWCLAERARSEGQAGAKAQFVARMRDWEALRDAKTAADEEIARLGRESQQKAQGLASARAIVEAAEGGADALRVKIEALDKQAAKQRAEHEALIDSLGSAQDPTAMCPAGECMKARIPKFQVDLAASTAKGRELDTMRADAAKRLLSLEAAIERVNTLTAEVRDVNERLSAAQTRQKAEALPAAPKWEAAPVLAAEEIARRLGNADRAIAQLADSESRKATSDAIQVQIDTVEAQFKTHEREAALWDALVDLLKPGGLRATMLRAKVEAAVRSANDLLRHFEHDIRLLAEPWEIQAKIGGQWMPARCLSDGQKALVNLGLQCILARLTGFPVVVVDKQDIDSAMRLRLLKFCLNRADIQFLIFAPANERQPDGTLAKPKDIGLSQVTIFWVDNGQVQRTAPPAPVLTQA